MLPTMNQINDIKKYLIDIFQFCRPSTKYTPVEWVEKFINFKHDPTASRERFDFSLSPYLIDPLNEWDFDNIREVVICSPEQMGKSSLWQLGLLYSMIYKPCLSLVIYPSDDKAEKTNELKLKPLMKSIPELAAELKLPRSTRKDCFNFKRCISYFMGAGSRVSSYPAKIRCVDEIDEFIEHEGQTTRLSDVRKRARSFAESMLYIVCTPTGSKKPIWSEYERGSRGRWYLRCLNCNNLTIRSSDIHHLQWELGDNDQLKPDSIRLICPICKHEHLETDKREMNLRGKYKHEFPDLIHVKSSYQWGALAGQTESFAWHRIAEAQMLAGKSGDVADQIYFDNSIRGLPFKPRINLDASLEKMKRKIIHDIPFDKLEGIIYAGDTQDDDIYYLILGIDINSNVYVLRADVEKKLENIKNIVDNGFNDLPILYGIQDEGGHRTLEIRNWVQTIPNFYTYKGNNRIINRIERSNNEKKLLLMREINFRTDTLYYIHNSVQLDNNNLYFCDGLSDYFYNQILAYRADNAKKNGNELENWTTNGRPDHYFDCLKMGYGMFEYMKKSNISTWFKNQAQWIKNKKKMVYHKKSANFATSWKQ